MNTITISNFRKNIFAIADNIIKNSNPTLITSKNGNTVMVSEEDWNAVQETLYLLNVKGMRESLIDGMNTNIAECITEEDFNWDLE